ncbi:GNAT family N-acetyltransferase [Halpernia frigidisoli]|uniref:ElaA protein n=1 Tax=Halpernia frigidisoli TaxID=1125876 RepID=A0A1I3GSB4_9FLAO|nr:GNAT family N-acetyltransferase [Halpernia frigidisoli]SFI26279.1 ElaA protein [Halpernia frigidisoli]
MTDLVWKVKNFSELSAEEVYKILNIRQEVFVVEQTCYYLDADNYDQKAIHLWAEKNGEIVAYLRIFKENIKYPEASIGRVLTSKSVRGEGLGKILVGYSLQIIFNQLRSKSVRISAQDYLIKFYSNFGFVDTGKKYLEDDIPHTEMILKVD